MLVVFLCEREGDSWTESSCTHYPYPCSHTAIHTHIQPCTQTAIHTYPVPSEAAEDLSEEGGDDDHAPGYDHHTSGHDQAAAIPIPIELSPAQLERGRGKRSQFTQQAISSRVSKTVT